MCRSRAPKEVASWSDSWSLFDHKWLTRPFLSNRMVPIKNFLFVCDWREDNKLLSSCTQRCKLLCFLPSPIWRGDLPPPRDKPCCRCRKCSCLNTCTCTLSNYKPPKKVNSSSVGKEEMLDKSSFLLWKISTQRFNSLSIDTTITGLHSALANFRWTIGQ